jgi:hypothetical protein
MVISHRREIVMPYVRTRFSLIFFSLYLAAALVGISLEALAQIYPH